MRLLLRSKVVPRVYILTYSVVDSAIRATLGYLRADLMHRLTYRLSQFQPVHVFHGNAHYDIVQDIT